MALSPGLSIIGRRTSLGVKGPARFRENGRFLAIPKNARLSRTTRKISCGSLLAESPRSFGVGPTRATNIILMVQPRSPRRPTTYSCIVDRAFRRHDFDGEIHFGPDALDRLCRPHRSSISRIGMRSPPPSARPSAGSGCGWRRAELGRSNLTFLRDGCDGRGKWARCCSS